MKQNNTIILKPSREHRIMVEALKNRSGSRKYYSQDNSGLYDRAIRTWYNTAPQECYYITGPNGSVLQLADGRFADTVVGDYCADADDADEAMFRLSAESAGWSAHDTPLWGDMDGYAMEKYVGLR